MKTHRIDEVLFTSIGIAVLFSLLNTIHLFEKFPEVLLALWRQKLFSAPEQSEEASIPSPQSDDYLLIFFAETKRLLHHNVFSIFFSCVGVGVISWVIWMLDRHWLLNIAHNIQTAPLAVVFLLLTRLVFLFTGAISGIIRWRVLAIAQQTSQLGKKFDVNLQINHPDGCGGLSLIGDLCLILMSCLVPFPILVGSWLIFVNLLDPRFLKFQPNSFNILVSTLQAMIVPLVAIDFLGIFYPPITIHNAMNRAKSKLYTRLDKISQQINRLHACLLNDAANIDPKEGEVLEEKIDFLKRVYTRFSPIPTWPYRGGHLWSLTTAQIIPVVGMLSSIIGFFRAVFIK